MILPSPKIEAAASTDDTRPVLCHPYLLVREGQGWLQATDAYQCVNLPVELDEGDVSGSIPPYVLQAARMHTHRSIEPRLHCEAERFRIPTKDGDIVYPRPHPHLGVYPDIHQIYSTKPDADRIEFGINPGLFQKAARALGGTRLMPLRMSINVRDPMSPVILRAAYNNPYRPSDVNGSWALLMPVRLES